MKIFITISKKITSTLTMFSLIVLLFIPNSVNAGAVTTNNIVATGGTITTVTQGSLTYKVHTFTSSGTFQVTGGNGKVWYLVVAGGGGGGGYYHGAGGGAGGYRTNGGYTYIVNPKSYTVTVGAGGAGGVSVGNRGSNGGNSVFDTITSLGGGGGGSNVDSPATGGSGGGAHYTDVGAAGTAGQGFAGGDGGPSAPSYGSGGGGGSGGVGQNGTTYGGNGGTGTASSISGSSVMYAGGGGGSTFSGPEVPGTGSAGGGNGGNSITGQATDATNGTGSGGGGSERGGAPSRGGNGGSGIVIIRYLVGRAGSNASQNTRNTNGLVGLWSFDNADVSGTTAYDRSGQGNNGTLTNGPTKTIGKLGQALSLDGVSQYVSIPTQDRNTLSASAWIKLGTTSFSDNTYRLIMGGSGSWGWYIQSDRKTHFGKPGISEATVPTNAIPDTNWHHVAFTYDGSTVRYYLDGVANGTAGYSVTFSGSTSYAIGYGTTFGGYFFGAMDDARIYNRILSATEIKQLYSMGAQNKMNSSQNTRSTSGLVGLWSFDGPDMSGVTAYDRSGNGNNGTLTNGPAKAIGKIGQALSFDGSATYVSNGSNIIVDDTGGITYAVWVKPSGVIDYGSFGKFKSTNELTFNIGGVGNSNLAAHAILLGFRGSNYIYSDDSRLFIDNMLGKWHQITVVYNGGAKGSAANWTIYIDGSSVSVSAGGAMGGATNVNEIGRDNAGGGYFKGSIDDVRIYNRALSAAEVKALYLSGK